MTREDAKNELRSRIVAIEFQKANGDIRQMEATLMDDFLPETEASVNSTRRRSDETLAVWDTEISAWRSFRWDSLQSFDGQATPNGL